MLPPAETAAMLFWALLASGPAANASRFREITMRKVDGWQALGEKPAAPSLLTPTRHQADHRPLETRRSANSHISRDGTR